MDGRFLIYPVIRAATPFLIKQLEFNLDAFLGDDDLATAYDGGAMAVARLDLADYHHFHFPAEGVAGPPRIIHGRYHAVSPYSRRRSVPAFAENTRMITQLDASPFGPIVMVEVGAFTVGSIRQCFKPFDHVAKGDHKGYFEFGASVVVLLFPSGVAAFDKDLRQNSSDGLETYLRLGDSLARRPTAR